MRVFLSWSGSLSKAVAELLKEWLKWVLHASSPWLSSKDIEKGSLWFGEISDQLKNTCIGIVCLTKENMNRPWILFESGALAKGMSTNRICTFLVNLRPSDLHGPLAQFNHTMPSEEDLRQLVRTINGQLGDASLDDRTLDHVFETYWPQFESKLEQTIADHAEDLDESATLTGFTRDIVAKLVGANSSEAIQSTLVNSLVQRHLSDQVTSAFIRIHDKETATWRASQHGAGQYWQLVAGNATLYGDNRSLNVLGYEPRELFGDLLSTTEKSQLKRQLTRQGVPSSECDCYIRELHARCSIPIIFGDRTFGILAVQGGRKLLEGEFLETLKLVCSVAGSLLHLHERIDDLIIMKEYKRKMLRWFSHDATKPVIALRELCIEPMLRGFVGESTGLAQRASQLIDIIAAQFLAYGMLGGIKEEWENESYVNLRSIFEPIVTMVSSDASEVKLDMSEVPDVNCRIDRLKTMAIVHNLIDNALNAIRGKQRQLKKCKETSKKRAKLWKINISATLKDGNLLISVTDNGNGFTEEEKELIFEESSGQGLAIVKGFTVLAGGTVTCESTAGLGATFEISIPNASE